jgi:hypothetical protein
MHTLKSVMKPSSLFAHVHTDVHLAGTKPSRWNDIACRNGHSTACLQTKHARS